MVKKSIPEVMRDYAALILALIAVAGAFGRPYVVWANTQKQVSDNTSAIKVITADLQGLNMGQQSMSNSLVEQKTQMQVVQKDVKTILYLLGQTSRSREVTHGYLLRDE